MSSLAIRFTVVDGDYRAHTWKVWTNRHDIYVACREHKGALKLSMHESGSWHYGFNREQVAKSLGEDHPLHSNPYKQIWERPSELAPGTTLALRIIVVAGTATTPLRQLPTKVTRVAAAPAGKAVEFAVILTSRDCQVSGWPCRRSMATELTGVLSTMDGGKLWVVHHHVIPPPFLPKTADITWLRSPEDCSDGPIGTIGFGKHEDGSRYLIERPATLSTKNGERYLKLLGAAQQAIAHRRGG